jgi:hypothetical protein
MKHFSKLLEAALSVKCSFSGDETDDHTGGTHKYYYEEEVFLDQYDFTRDNDDEPVFEPTQLRLG